MNLKIRFIECYGQYFFFYDHASCYKSTLRLSPLLDFESEFNLACILQEHQVNLSNDNKDILTLRCILIDRHKFSIPVYTELARKYKKMTNVWIFVSYYFITLILRVLRRQFL